jgi:hypothetical protein
MPESSVRTERSLASDKTANLPAKTVETDVRSSNLCARLGELRARLGELHARLGELHARLGELLARLGDLLARRLDFRARRDDLRARRSDLLARRSDFRLRRSDLRAPRPSVRCASVWPAAHQALAPIGPLLVMPTNGPCRRAVSTCTRLISCRDQSRQAHVRTLQGCARVSHCSATHCEREQPWTT